MIPLISYWYSDAVDIRAYNILDFEATSVSIKYDFKTHRYTTYVIRVHRTLKGCLNVLEISGEELNPPQHPSCSQQIRH